MSTRTTAARAGRIPAPKLNCERFELDCGAILVVDRRPGAPVTAAKLHLKGGHSLDPVGLEGTASLAGALLDRGTKRHTEEELAALLEPSGGGLRGEANGLSGSIAGNSSKLLLELMCEVVLEAKFPKAKFDRQKERLLDRLLVERDDHRTQAGRRFRQLVYGDHWMGRSPYGTIESVQAIERKHVAAYHRTNWCPTRAVIAVSGDVDPKTVKRLLDRQLVAWRKRAPLAQPNLDFPGRSPRFDAFQADRSQVHVYLGHLGVQRTTPHYPALVVMDHILGTGPGFSNRISRTLRDEQGLAYTVHADIHSSAGVFPGMFTAYIGTSPDNAERAVAGFLAEMRRIRDELVTDEELLLAKNYLLGSYAMGYERAARRAGYMILAERFGLPPDHLERLPDSFAAVTAEDVQAAARACLHPDEACLVIGGPMSRREVQTLFQRTAGSSRTGGRSGRRTPKSSTRAARR